MFFSQATWNHTITPGSGHKANPESQPADWPRWFFSWRQWVDGQWIPWMQGDIGAPHCWNHKQLLFHWHSPVKTVGWNSQATKKENTTKEIKQSNNPNVISNWPATHPSISKFHHCRQSRAYSRIHVALPPFSANKIVPKNFERIGLIESLNWATHIDITNSFLQAIHWHGVSLLSKMCCPSIHNVSNNNRFLCSHDSWGSGLCHTAGTCRLTPSMPIFDTASTSWTQCCLNEPQQPPWMQQHKYVHLYSPWYIYIYIYCIKYKI